MAGSFLAAMTDGPKEKTYINRVKDFKDREALVYLTLHHFKHLQPERLSSKKFATQILQQAANVKALSAFFAGYADLAKVLHNQYHFEELHRPDELLPTDFALTKFSQAERHFLENYKSKPKKKKKKSVQ